MTEHIFRRQEGPTREIQTFTQSYPRNKYFVGGGAIFLLFLICSQAAMKQYKADRNKQHANVQEKHEDTEAVCRQLHPNSTCSVQRVAHLHPKHNKVYQNSSI